MPAPKIADGQLQINSFVEETDIRKYFEKYTLPIDSLRSFSKPNLSKTDVVRDPFKGLNISKDKPMESRIHAFYRMLGLPVVTASGFFSPGFNPDFNSKEDKKAYFTALFNKSQSKTDIAKREDTISQIKNIFLSQDLSASLYALSLTDIRVFNILSLKNQASEISAREERINNFIDNNKNNLAISENAEAALAKLSSTPVKSFKTIHLLKPFIVDPDIDATIMPDSRLVCVPFLDIGKTLLSKESQGISLKRPGIELIIRQKLTNSSDNQTVDTFINNLKSESRAIIKKIIKNQNTIEIAVNKIGWLPIPSVDGPETGPRGALLNNDVTTALTYDLNKKIASLKLQKLQAQQQIDDEANLGEFASPFIVHSTEDLSGYERDLAQAVQNRDRLAESAFNAMAEIEMAMGEVSGLGLIDIICIYIALWKMKINDILGLIDDASFNRLSKISNFTQSVSSSGRNTNISSCLNSFEQEISTALDEADNEFKEQRSLTIK